MLLGFDTKNFPVQSHQALAKSRLHWPRAHAHASRNRRARRIARGRLLGPGESARSFRAGALARSTMEASLDVGAGSVPGEIGPHSDAARGDEMRTESSAQDAGAAAVIVVSDEEELSPMSCAGDSSVSIPVMQVLEEDGAQLEQDIAAGGVTVTLTELKLKGTVDLTASTALLAMASLTIVFGAVWSLSDQMVHFKKDETESERAASRAEAARGSGLEGLEITESSAAYFVVFASVVLLIIFFS